VRDHDRTGAGRRADGLDYGRRLAAEGARFLKRKDAHVEFGDGEAEGLREVLERQMWVVER